MASATQPSAMSDSRSHMGFCGAMTSVQRAHNLCSGASGNGATQRARLPVQLAHFISQWAPSRKDRKSPPQVTSMASRSAATRLMWAAIGLMWSHSHEPDPLMYGMTSTASDGQLLWRDWPGLALVTIDPGAGPTLGIQRGLFGIGPMAVDNGHVRGAVRMLQCGCHQSL
jgi:hypothetical protein